MFLKLIQFINKMKCKWWDRPFRWEKRIPKREMWALNSTISKFIATRLKMFKTYTISFPGHFDSETGWERWQEILHKMLVAFEYLAELSNIDQMDMELPFVKKGIALFIQYYYKLWA